MDTIINEIFEYVISGNATEVKEKVQAALDGGMDPDTLLKAGLISAMDQVGQRFESGDFFVPEMLVAARAMQAGLSILKPHLVQDGIKAAGTVVLGTVKGDLHDIGKNLVAMMLEGAGFEIVDLGTDVEPEAFVDAIKEKNAEILGLSALLTTTMQNMSKTITLLQETGLRDKVFVMIGGAPVTDVFAKEIGADGYAPDASRAVTLAKTATAKTAAA